MMSPGCSKDECFVKRFFRHAGLISCFIAILAMSGGHWLALQSWAWTQMLMAFSRSDSLGQSISKTFDGQHPCSLCVTIQEGMAQEQQQQRDIPLLKREKMPESVWQLRHFTTAPILTQATTRIPFVPSFYSDFIDSPSTPPPRS